MTVEQDPPLLRALGHELPGELLRALESSRAEDAEPRELVQLRASIQRALSADQVAERPRPRRTVRSRALSLALTFTVGAGAGTVVSTGLVYWLRAPAPLEVPNARELSPPSVPPLSHSAEPARPRREGAPPSEPVPEPSALRPERSIGSSRAPLTSSSARGAPADELAILARAQAALANSPKTALALVAEHERTFAGSSALAQEREVIAIDALLRLSRTTEAESRAKRFHRRFPASAHGRRVDVLFEVR